MYSVNAPVPASVQRLALDFQGDLLGFDAIRERHTLVVKRLGSLDPTDYAATEERVRAILRNVPACEAAVTGIGYFERPASGAAPVVYLAVESPGILAIHDRLAEVFGTADGIEGEGYVPHVTLARGSDWESARRLAEREIEPVRWTIDSLVFWDGRYGEPISEISLGD